jgi:hypothetical protein
VVARAIRGRVATLRARAEARDVQTRRHVMPKIGPSPTKNLRRKVKRLRGVLVAAAASIIVMHALAPAHAAEVESSLRGSVTQVEDAEGFEITTLLAQRGLRVGTPVTISITLNDAVNPVARDGGTGYSNGVISMSVNGGLYQASYDRQTGGATPSAVLSIDGADDGSDAYTIETPTAMDSADIVRGGPAELPATLTLSARDATGAAMADESILQDVAAFPTQGVTLTIEGAGGRVVITIGEDDSSESSALCRRWQIAAAGSYSAAYLKCRGKRASRPSVKDLGGEKEARCLVRARARFETAFGKAIAKAERKGGTCVLGEDAIVSTADDLANALSNLTDTLLVDADRLDSSDRAFRGKLLNAAAAQASKDLKAYAQHLKKPNQSKLELRLLANRDKTLRVVERAIVKAIGNELDVGTLSGLSVATSVRSVVDAHVRDVGGASR